MNVCASRVASQGFLIHAIALPEAYVWEQGRRGSFALNMQNARGWSKYDAIRSILVGRVLQVLGVSLTRLR